MYAIFENGSKQYKACIGDLVKVENLNRKVGDTVEFPVVMTADDNGIQTGAAVKDLKVKAEVILNGKDKKIIVFKYKAKKNERKKQGHRQPFTQVKITAIGAVSEEKKPAPKKAAKPVEAEVKAEAAKEEVKTESVKEVKEAKTEVKKPAEKKPAKTEVKEVTPAAETNTELKEPVVKPVTKKTTAKKTAEIKVVSAEKKPAAKKPAVKKEKAE